MAISNGYLEAMKVSVAEAKDKLSELIKAVEDGEIVTICRRGVSVVDIVPTKDTLRKPRKLGTLREKFIANDPDWWKPMSDKEVENFLEEGRY
jgi:prevent-host-death family protein